MPLNPDFSVEDLALPSVVDRSPFTTPYHAFEMAARYAGISPQQLSVPGHWMHGWHPPAIRNGPHSLFGTEVSPHERLFVGHQDDADYLRQHGYSNVTPIGLPITYVAPPEVIRRPRSLLVMPVHSLEYTRHTWNFDKYADEISSIRHEFDLVVACVHPSCIRQGYWVSAFESRGISVVEGATATDINAIQRIRHLLGQFEFVTSNGFGSHLAYAAYCGCKASIFGTFADYHAEDFRNCPFYGPRPKLLAEGLHKRSESYLRLTLPELFCRPDWAEQRTAWAEAEMGKEHCLPPTELLREFSWTFGRRVARRIHTALKAAERLPRRVRRAIFGKRAA